MNDVMQGRLEAGRKQGRPRTHYTQNFREWTGMNTYLVYNTARRTDEWRTVVREAMRPALFLYKDGIDRSFSFRDTANKLFGVTNIS